MTRNPSQVELDVEAYRRTNGARALQTVLFSGKSFVVKRDAPEKVLLVSVDSHAEVEVPSADFERDSIVYALDEMGLHFGTKEQQAAVLAAHNAVHAAVEICLYGVAKRPATA